jgi:hypothetical protein
MRRIGLVVTLVVSVALGTFAPAAQPQGKLPLVGVLEPGRQQLPTARCRPAFEQTLRNLGYVEGRTVRLAYRFGEDRADRLPALAAELVQLAPDVIWLHSTPAALAAQVRNRRPNVKGSKKWRRSSCLPAESCLRCSSSP